MGSAVASTSTGKTGETEQGEGARGGNIDNETGLLAGSAKTLVPSDFERRTSEVEAAVVGEAADEHTEASGTIANSAVEARGATVVPTGEVAGYAAPLPPKFGSRPVPEPAPRCLSRLEVKAHAADGDERIRVAKSFGVEDRTEVGGGPANAGRALEVVDLTIESHVQVVDIECDICSIVAGQVEVLTRRPSPSLHRSLRR